MPKWTVAELKRVLDGIPDDYIIATTGGPVESSITFWSPDYKKRLDYEDLAVKVKDA